MNKRFLVLGLILAFGLGLCLATLWAVRHQAPSWQTPTRQPSEETIAVQPIEFRDQKEAVVELSSSGLWEAKAPASGVLRKNACAPGTQINSGKFVALVDDNPILAIHTASPLFRDLTIGTIGDDVLQLNNELARLGKLSNPTKTYSWASANALKALTSEEDKSDHSFDTLPLSSVIWIPSEQVMVSTCPSQIGATISPENVLFTTNITSSSLKLTIPDGALKGARIAVLGDKNAPITEDGSVSDPEFLKAFFNSPRYQQYIKDPKNNLTLTTKLAEALPASGVPASAIYNASDNTGCILLEGKPQRVNIVSSQFGITTVTSENNLTGSVSIAPKKDAPACA